MANSEIIHIIAYSRPFEYEYNLRQKYFWEGLDRYANSIDGRFEIISDTNWPRIVSFLGRLNQTYRFKKFIRNNEILSGGIGRIASKLEGEIQPPSSFFQTMVGQYIFRINDIKEYKICIESGDGSRVVNDELLNWCDLYFKANYWGSKKYPKKVVPIYYPQPAIMGHIEKLHAYRNINKQYDICCIVKVRGGRGYGSEGDEHILRLVEEISKIDCRKFIYALLGEGEKKYENRLKMQRIPCGTKLLPMHEVWRISAQSRLNIARLGWHYCIPWRTYEILAMGGCIVFESTPYSIWPVPLVENENFLSLNLGWCDEKPVASNEEYMAVQHKIESWLADKTHIERIRKNNETYFDNHLEPRKVGAYIVNTLLKTL
jgi:hypothetical protein